MNRLFVCFFVCLFVFSFGSLLYVILLIDCGAPAKTGYAYSVTTGTTYGETASVSCAEGYEGTISSSSVTCEAAGTWTDVTGCTIKGTIKFMKCSKFMSINS